MDIHMPVMDGLTATRLIRAERQGKPLPILALTANAMKEEVEACRMAGMDDYLGKPIRRDALFAAIKRWTQPKLPDPSIPPSGTIPVVEGMDLQEAVARIGLPWPRFAKLLLRFMQSEPKTLSALLQAVEAKDYPTSRRLAHSLSGAAGTMGAHALARLARQLEQAAGSADLTEPMEAVELEAKRVFQSLQALKL
jgi:CheY-like chemotaxis protein